MSKFTEADLNETIDRINAHADSLASVPHNKQFRADLYLLVDAVKDKSAAPADAEIDNDHTHPNKS